MLPAFGCGLRRYLMEPNTLTTRTAMQQDIEHVRCSRGSRGSGSTTSR